MHYSFNTNKGATCDIDGNYGQTGLSKWDRLTLHILYPEDQRVVEFTGDMIVRSDQDITLISDWGLRGANMYFATYDWQWKINGVLQSSAPLLIRRFTPGKYQLEISHKDFLDRDFYYKGEIQVLKTDDYIKMAAGTVTTAIPLM